MQTKFIGRLQQIPSLRAVYSKHLLLALIIYPILISLVSVFLMKAFAPITPNTQATVPSDILSLFVTIASTFCLIPAGILLIFSFPTYIRTKDPRKFIYSGGLIKTALIASIIAGISLLTSLFLF